jgi:hypothetical protein
VPPPPVTGAPVGVAGGLVTELGAGVRVGLLDADALGEELGLTLAAPLEAEGIPVGADTVPDVTDGVQPASAAEVRMAKTPRRMTISFVLSLEPAITRTVT